MLSISQLYQGQIARRLVISIILFSSIITVVLTGIQIFLDYRSDISKIEKNIDNIQHVYLKSLAFSVWQLDELMIDTQLDGLLKLPDIEYLAIEVDGKVRWEAGSNILKYTHTRSFPLVYQQSADLGVITVIASIDAVYSRLTDKVLIVLVSNGVKTFIVAGFTLYLFFILVTRHLNTLTKYLENLDADRLDIPLSFQDRKETHHIRNEFDMVAHSINIMRVKLSQSHDALKDNQQDLTKLLAQREILLENERKHKEQLEITVSERTSELQQRSRQLEEQSLSLQHSLETLKSTQARLIETEKIAALGNLVAGVAHEINTPIGICMTAASWQKDQTIAIGDCLEDKTLTGEQLADYLEGTVESSELIEKNIRRANTLIGSFKMVATDQMHDVKKSFLLHEYIDEIKNTITPSFKKFKITFELDIADDIELNSYSGTFYQVFLNLITNSVIHGFGDNNSGRISITAAVDDATICIHYSDDGVGFSAEVSKMIFQPFFTTRRHKGGAGLGMAIVFNAITGQLGGDIQLADSVYGKGAGFEMTLPIDAPDKPGNEIMSFSASKT